MFIIPFWILAIVFGIVSLTGFVSSAIIRSDNSISSDAYILAYNRMKWFFLTSAIAIAFMFAGCYANAMPNNAGDLYVEHIHQCQHALADYDKPDTICRLMADYMKDHPEGN